MGSFDLRFGTRPWSIPLPWAGKFGMALALAFALSVVLFSH
jgi:hypothetical protein